MIKFNLLFYCCLSHPTLMIRASTAQHFMYNHNKNDPISASMEDYELWLRLTFGEDADELEKPIKFYNLG